MQTVTATTHPGGVEQVQPPEAVASAIVDGSPANPRGTMCNLGHFYASGDAASQWLDHHPRGYVLSVHDAFQYAFGVMRRLLAEP